MENKIALEESKVSEKRLSNKEKARQRRLDMEGEIYGTFSGDKTLQQCYNWWRRKHLCILRGVKDEKNNFGFDRNFNKMEMLKATSNMLNIIKAEIDAGYL